MLRGLARPAPPPAQPTHMDKLLLMHVNTGAASACAARSTDRPQHSLHRRSDGRASCGLAGPPRCRNTPPRLLGGRALSSRLSLRSPASRSAAQQHGPAQSLFLRSASKATGSRWVPSSLSHSVKKGWL